MMMTGNRSNPCSFATGARSFLRACRFVWIFALVSACTTVGNNFDGGALTHFQPGQTTLVEAVQAFTAPPSEIFPQRDGTSYVRWAYKFSIVTDGLYSRKSVTLQFGPDQRLIRLVDSTNLLIEPWLRTKLLTPPQYPEPWQAGGRFGS